LYAISSDGRWLTASYGATGLWRIDGPEPKFITWLDQTGEGPSRVAFSRDGNSAVVGNCHGFIRFWDLSGAEPKELSPLDRAKAHRAPTWLARPQISPRANRLMSATFDPPKEGTARFQLWDFAGPLPRQEPGPDAPLDLRSGTLFPLAGDRWLQIPPHESLPSRFEVRDQRWQSVGEPFGRIGHGAVSGDGKWMMQLSGANLGELKLDGWDVSGEPVQKWSLPFPMKGNAGNWRMDSSWQGTSFAVFHGDEGGELALFRNTGAKPEQTGTIPIKTPGGGYRAALSPDGRTLAHLRDTFNGDIVLEDISTGKPREILRSGEQSGLGYLTWVSFSPDGRHLAYASYSSIGVLDAKTLKPVYQWETTPGVTNWIDWAADGRHLLMHNSNQTIYVLRLQPAVFANR
jgi:WD40 repeat protein